MENGREGRSPARRLAAAYRILRPGNAAMTSLAVGVGAFVAGGAAALGSRPLEVGAAAAVAFAFVGAANARNDLADHGIDRLAHPDRPLPRGLLLPAEVRAGVLALYGLALAGAAVLGPAPFALVVLGLGLMEAYERRLKAQGLPGNAVVALLAAAPFVLGGLVAGALPVTLLALAGLAGLSTLGREILKDVEDAAADAGRRTLPHRVGTRAATRAGVAAVVAAVALSPAPYLLETLLGWTYLPVVGLADAGFLAAAGTASRPGRAQRLAKASMLVALLAFVVGRLQAEGVG